MSQDNLARLQCATCKTNNYNTTRNRRIKTRLKLRKHCPSCKTHTEHNETK